MEGQFVKPGERGDLFERTVATVAEEQDRLPVRDAVFHTLQLRIGVAVRNQKFGPAIVVKIHKTSSPSYIRVSGSAKTGRPTDFLKVQISLVPLKIDPFLAKIRYHNAQPPFVPPTPPFHT